MKDHLIFDTLDIDTIEATDSVGAHIRSGKAGALITHHADFKAAPAGFSFVDGDVTVGSDSIAETAHGLLTGDKVRLTTSGVLPAGLALLTDYYVIRVDANNFKLASSAYNAEWNKPVDITAAAGGGTHNVVGQSQDVRALDVWVMNPVSVSGTVELGATTLAALENITVSATDLDIRDLAFATDKVDVTGSTVELGATTLAALETITVNQGTSPWVVQAGAEKAEDSIHNSGDTGNFVLAVRNDANTALAADGDYTPFQTDAQGRLKVSAEVTVQAGDAEFLEDSIHNNADAGIHILAVRQDTLSSLVSADGDYASLKVNADGRLYVDVGTVSINDAALANTAIAHAANPLNVAGTSEDVVASPLANRKYLWIYNNDNTKVYIGAAGVTAATGFPVSPGSYLELRAGAAVDIEFVGDSGKTPNIRTLELS